MKRVRRLLAIPLLVWIVATLAFFLMRAAPGGPFDRERAPASREVEAALQARYHLDESLGRQYLRFLAGLVQGDLGPSFKYRHHTVNDILAQALPVSLTLGWLAFGTALGIGIPTGFIGAVHRGRWPDWAGSFLVLTGVCIPTFVLAPILVLIFSLRLGWLPVALMPVEQRPVGGKGISCSSTELTRSGRTERPAQSPWRVRASIARSGPASRSL
jgi:oligopeptide transport system permease protein